MKKLLCMFTAICLMFSSFPTLTFAEGKTKKSAETPTIIIDTDSIIVDDFIGAGVQIDPSDVFDYSEEEWKMITDRLDYANFPFIRTIFRSDFYCKSIDDEGNAVYDWDSKYMKRVYRILDYIENVNKTKDRDISVIIGEWDKPDMLGITQTDDYRWAILLSDMVHHLKVTKGYECIKFVNCVNEPNGDWAISDIGDNYNIWRNAIKNLDEALRKKGIRDQIEIVGPDSTSADSWVMDTVDDLGHIIDIYDIHRYASDDNVLTGELEQTLIKLKDYIDLYVPGKQIFMGECGMTTGLNSNDQQMRVFDFEYGVFMADYYAQVLRGGAAGTIAWDLDDSMHRAPTSYGSFDPTGAHKIWGFWNTKGGVTDTGADGVGSTEEDKNIRPWFYTMSLYSRLFPEGSQIIYSGDTNVKGLKVVAAKVSVSGGKHKISFAVVNNQYKGNGNYEENAVERTLKVVIPGAENATVDLKRYNYFADDMEVDENGFPVGTSVTGNLAQGIEVTMDGNGVVFFETEEMTLLKDGEVNIALGKDVTVSSSGYPMQYKSSYINDGNRVTKWLSNPDNKQEIVVDLGENKSFNRVKLDWAEGFAKGYVISVSENDTDYTDVFSQFNDGVGYIEDVVFNKVDSARYIKIKLNIKGDSTLNYGIREIAVYNTDAGKVTEAPAPMSPEIIDEIDVIPSIFMESASGLILDTGNVDQFYGDAGRTKRNGPSAGYVIYKVEDLETFNALMFYDPSETKLGAKDIFEVSADGRAWVDITSKLIASDEKTRNGWESRVLSAGKTEFGEGMKYLKITTIGGNGWSPQLSRIEINAKKTIEDTLEDFSKIGLKSAGWKIDKSDITGISDSSRAVRNTTDKQYMIYALNDLYSFVVDVYNNEIDESAIVKLYSSVTGTGNSFKEIASVDVTAGDYSDSWRKVTYSATGLPVGTKYVKVELSGGSDASMTQISNIKLAKTPDNVFEVKVNGGFADKGTYQEGDTVTITADAIEGKVFTNWVTTDGVTFDDEESSTTTFIMPAKAATVTAMYKAATGDELTAKTIEDDCSDFSKVFDKGGLIQLDTGDDWGNFSGDINRFKRGWNDAQHIIYDADVLNSFTVYTHEIKTESGKFSFSVSADNSVWVSIDVTSEDISTGNEWTQVKYTPSTALPKGMRYLKIDITGGSEDKPYAPQVGQVDINKVEAKIIEDDCSTFDKVMDKGGLIQLDTGDDWGNFSGDVNRFKRGWNDQQHITYDADLINGFEIFTHEIKTETGKFKFSVSADNSTWLDIDVNSKDISTGNEWTQVKYTPASSVPKGMKYLKITISGGSEDKPYAPQVGQVNINMTTVDDSDDNDDGDNGEIVPEDFTVTIVDGTTDKETYKKGDTVTITAGEKNGMVFEKWESEDGIEFSDLTGETTTFVMPEKNVTVVARFKVKEPVTPPSTDTDDEENGGNTGDNGNNGDNNNSDIIHADILKDIIASDKKNELVLGNIVNGSFSSITITTDISGLSKELRDRISAMDSKKLDEELKAIVKTLSDVNTTEMSEAVKAIYEKGVKGLRADAKVMPLVFADHKNFIVPVKMSITLDKAKFPAGKYYLYYINEEGKKVEENQIITVDENGNTLFTITGCSSYFISSSKIGGTNSDVSNPQTGDAFIITAVFAVLACGAYLLITSKKSKNK